MSKLEICWILLFNLFGNNPDQLSQGYTKKIINNIYPKLQTCTQVYKEAEKQYVDPLLAISVAYHESRFKNVSSNKGAKGPLGVIPKYHCPKNKKCNYIEAGISALKKFLELNQYDQCKTLAQYNRGLNGKCLPGRPEYKYAQNIINLYNSIYNMEHCKHETEC